MATGYPLQSPSAQALQNRQDQGPCSCPYPDHGGRIFQDFQEFLDHAKIEHRSDFGGLDTRQSGVKLRELLTRFRRSDHFSVAKAGDRSAPDIGGLTSELEEEPRRTSPTSGRKRSAPTDHEFAVRKGQAPCPVQVADPDYPRYTPSPYPTTPEPSSGWSTDATKSNKLASSQPQSSDPQPQRTITKPRPSQCRLGILYLLHTDARDPKWILQPDNRPISQEWLASLVKSIYAGLKMVETKCMDVDRAQAAAIAEEGEARTSLASDHWQALIALHRTLLHEHHAFFLVSQHPSSSPALRRLAGKHSMPARLWEHGIKSFLEILLKHLPESKEHMVAFIYLAYQTVTLFYETVPAFEDTWIECLGDLGRFRMAIEDDVRDHKTWAGVARSWYVKAADKNPIVGRLYHHLAILARPHVLLQMYYYSRSFTSVKPFQTARDSIKILLDPIVEKAQHTPLDNLLNEEVFVLAHATQFNHSSIEKDSFGIDKPTAKFSASKAKFLEKLEICIGRVTANWKDLGVYVAVANIAGWFDYGEDKNLIRHALLQQLYPPLPRDSLNEDNVNVEANRKTAPPSDQQESEKKKDKEDKIPETAEEWEKAQKRIENNCHINNARLLTNETSALVFRRLGDKNVLPHVHVMLAFLLNIASSKHVSFLIADAPWAELVAFLNTLIKTEIRLSQSENKKQDINTLLAIDVFPREGERDDELPLPEDYHIRGQIWAQHFSENWFEREHDEEGRYLELASTAKNRVERILRLGYQIAKFDRWISYDEASHCFELLALVFMRTEASH